MRITVKISAIKELKSSSFIFAFVFFLFLVFDADARQTETLVPIGGSFQNAVSVDVTPRGTLFIVEKDRHRFLVLNQEGTRIDSTGNQGRGNYQFDRPLSIDATNGLKIYVADRNNNRVQIFDRRYQFLSSVTAAQIRDVSRFRPEIVAVNRMGELLVYNSERHQIHKFDSNGNFEMTFDLRSNLIRNVDKMTVSQNQMMILEKSTGTLHRFNFEGIYESFLGGFGNAKTIRHFKGSLWRVEDGRLLRLNRVGEVTEEYKFDAGLSVSDFVIFENSAYLLTPDTLYKLRLSGV